MSPTGHTLNYLRKLGAIVQVVEYYNKWAKRRIDLFENIDIIAIHGKKLVGIQATDGTSHSKRLTKALESDKIRAWLGTGAGFEVWSWSKRGARGARKLWTPRVTQLCLTDNGTVRLL